jgi:hypothetical protein
MRTPALAAFALIIVGSGGSALAHNGEAWYQRAGATIRPLAKTELFDQREVIAPPAVIDPGIALMPPDNQGRLRVVEPPGTLDDGLHVK